MISSLTRRKFVVLGGSGIAAIGINPSAFAASGASSLVSVGYFGARRTLRSRTPVQRAFVQATAGTMVGDGALLETEAAFRLHDVRFGPRSSARLAVDVLFMDENLDVLPFHAFSSTIVRGRRSSSNPVTFNVPVTSSSSVTLQIEYTAADASARVEMIPFNVNASGPEIPLATGLYGIALLGQGQQVPDWRSIRPVGLDSADWKSPLTLVEDRFTGTESVPFDYILFTVTPRSAPVPPVDVTAAEEEMAGTD